MSQDKKSSLLMLVALVGCIIFPLAVPGAAVPPATWANLTSDQKVEALNIDMENYIAWSHTVGVNMTKVLERLDALEASGKITPEEATGIRNLLTQPREIKQVSPAAGTTVLGDNSQIVLSREELPSGPLTIKGNGSSVVVADQFGASTDGVAIGNAGLETTGGIPSLVGVRMCPIEDID